MGVYIYFCVDGIFFLEFVRLGDELYILYLGYIIYIYVLEEIDIVDNLEIILEELIIFLN